MSASRMVDSEDWTFSEAVVRLLLVYERRLTRAPIVVAWSSDFLRARSKMVRARFASARVWTLRSSPLSLRRPSAFAWMSEKAAKMF